MYYNSHIYVSSCLPINRISFSILLIRITQGYANIFTCRSKDAKQYIHAAKEISRRKHLQSQDVE